MIKEDCDRSKGEYYLAADHNVPSKCFVISIKLIAVALQVLDAKCGLIKLALVEIQIKQLNRWKSYFKITTRLPLRAAIKLGHGSS